MCRQDRLPNILIQRSVLVERCLLRILETLAGVVFADHLRGAAPIVTSGHALTLARFIAPG